MKHLEIRDLWLQHEVAEGRVQVEKVEGAAEQFTSILDTKMHRHVLLSLAYTSSNWDEETGGEFTEEKVFETVKYVYDNMPGKELRTLLPKFGVWFEEIIDGRKSTERKKMLTLFFNAKWVLEIKFILEKKRVNNNLVDLAD